MAKQVAFITGSSRGIGFGIAEALARKGFSIALNDFEESKALQDAVDKIQAQGGEAIKLPMDVTDHSAYEKALDHIESRLGPLTTLVNNAGVSVLKRGDMLEVSEESFDRCIAVNTKAVFFLSQAFARRLVNRERAPSCFYSIITISSSNARAVALPRTEYTVSKAAAAMVSQALAIRLGGEGIHVYDVQPGLIETDMTKPVIESYKKRAEDGLTVLPRVGQPKEMGEIVATLASGGLPYVTGQVISADGGLLLSRF